MDERRLREIEQRVARAHEAMFLLPTERALIHTDVPHLIAEVRRLRTALATVRDTLRAWNRSALDGNDIGDDQTLAVGYVIDAALEQETTT